MVDEEDEMQVGYARRYRPVGFEDYIGNQKVSETSFTTLRRPINEWPQTIALYGNTGCGKTTMARILIREYMCEDRSPETGACGECVSCEYMDEYIKTGNHEYIMDLEEIDITQRSGKDAIMELIDSMRIPPQAGEWKVYYFDEFHQATDAAQSSLLKVIEEPPERVLMLFATTDPEKIKGTIRNRMALTLRIEKPKTDELIKHLANISRNEGVPFDVSGLRMICMLSGNVIRESLNFLEQVVKTRGGATEDSVSEEFDVVGDDTVFTFIEAYQERNYLEYISTLYHVTQKMSMGSFIISLREFLTRGIYVLNSIEVDGLHKDELVRYKKLFSRFEPEDIATLLANMQKVHIGDPVANMMAFIYTEDDFKAKGIDQNASRGLSYSDEEEVAKSESKVRSKNIESLRSAGSDKAEARLAEEAEVVTSDQILKTFSPKPVRHKE